MPILVISCSSFPAPFNTPVLLLAYSWLTYLPHPSVTFRYTLLASMNFLLPTPIRLIVDMLTYLPSSYWCSHVSLLTSRIVLVSSSCRPPNFSVLLTSADFDKLSRYLPHPGVNLPFFKPASIFILPTPNNQILLAFCRHCLLTRYLPSSYWFWPILLPTSRIGSGILSTSINQWSLIYCWHCLLTYHSHTSVYPSFYQPAG